MQTDLLNCTLFMVTKVISFNIKTMLLCILCNLTFSTLSQVAEMIRHVIDSHTQPIPAVLEIPSKDHPYDASKDSILRRARV